MPQSLVKVYVHLVFSTKHRLPTIDPEKEARLHRYMTGIVKHQDSLLVRIGGMPDHVHLLVLLSQKHALAELLQHTKKDSSKFAKRELGIADFQWQDGYAAFSVSESNVDRCVNYINNQKKHHAKMTFQEELRMLLKRHRVAFDERYIWD